MNRTQSLRPFVTFDAEFPDDGVFTQSGDPDTPAGKNIVDCLVVASRRRNLKVTDAVQHSFYGWQFTVIRSDGTFWFLLQCPGPWLLLSHPRLSFFEKLAFKNTTAAHKEVLEIIHECLVQDRRFGNVRWFTKEEYESRSNDASSY